jgi:hypothetical protein
VLSFSQAVGIGTPPTPHPQASVPVLGGGAHSLAREGLGESQFRRGDTLYSIPMYVICGKEPISNTSNKNTFRVPNCSAFTGRLSNSLSLMLNKIVQKWYFVQPPRVPLCHAHTVRAQPGNNVFRYTIFTYTNMVF